MAILAATPASGTQRRGRRPIAFEGATSQALSQGKPSDSCVCTATETVGRLLEGTYFIRLTLGTCSYRPENENQTTYNAFSTEPRPSKLCDLLTLYLPKQHPLLWRRALCSETPLSSCPPAPTGSGSSGCCPGRPMSHTGVAGLRFYASKWPSHLRTFRDHSLRAHWYPSRAVE